MHLGACVMFLYLFYSAFTLIYSKASITFPEASNEQNSLPFHFSEASVTGHLNQVAGHVANLGLHTLRNLLKSHSNVIISPLNMYSCLEILNVGAVGDTKEEIRRVLGPSDKNNTMREIVKPSDGVSYASALFLDQGFIPRKEFLETISMEFQTSVLNVNMADGERAKDSINGWVLEHTNGTIENFLQSRLDPNTRMVVVSALLFKGKWLHPFPLAGTFLGKFQTEGTSVDVPFMNMMASIPLVRHPHFDAISLPLIDAQGMMMHIVLPKEQGLQGARDLLSRLTPGSLRNLRKEAFPEEVHISLPKITFEGRFSLTNSLQAQGISAMFNPSRANFRAVADDSAGLYVSKFHHSIHFEMNEEGTEASAATAAILTKSRKFKFDANRPFIFIITDKSDFILFMGLLSNPVP